MSTTVMSHQSEPRCGSIALVAYLPDPLGAFLTGLRQALGGANNPEAHITFLPPRAISVPLERASARVSSLLASVYPLEVELGSIQIFPRTNSLYLSVEAGFDALSNLHNSLNSDYLFAEEPFEFTPHLTLSGPQAPASIERARSALDKAWRVSGFSPRFQIDEVVLLWQPGNYTERHWKRVSSYTLPATQT